MMLRRIGKLLGLETKASSVSLDDLLHFVGMPTAAGIQVTPATATRCAAWAAARRVTTGVVSSLPCHVHRRLPGGGKERAADHPASRLITRAPNDWLSINEWFAAGTADLMDHGNHVAIVTWVNGNLCEILPVPFEAVDIEGDFASGPRYHIRLEGGERREYPASEVLHVRLPGIRPWIGQGMVEQAREAIAVALVLEKYAGGLFGRGARPAGMVRVKSNTSPEALRRIKGAFEAAHTGGGNAGRILFVDDGVTFEPHQMSSTDAQFLEHRAFQCAEISRVTGVPLPLISELDRSTHLNSESLFTQWLAVGLMPLLKFWQSALNRTLFTEDERETYYVEFETNALVAADVAARYDAYTKAVQNGILNPNEVRSRESLAPYDGGDEYRVPLNTAPPGQDQSK